MKLGCCLNMNAVGNFKIGEECIPVFSGLGYDYVELPLAQIMDLSEDSFSFLLQTIKECGIPLEACNNFFPAGIRLTGENAEPGAALEYARRACGRAAALGAKIIVLGSSGAKNIPFGFPYEKARAQFTELLGRLQEIVLPLGITIVLEPLNRNESNFIVNVDEALSVMNEASCGNIKLLVDYYHMCMENEDPVEAVRKAGNNLRHVHIAARQGREFPRPGDGHDYAAFFAALKDAGYDGRVSVEAYSNNLPGDAEASAALIRSFIK